jgi:sporulation protein YlmC with PRC-barrel domain
MSETFKGSTGRRVLSSATAEDLGKVSHLVVDVGQRRVSSLVVGKGRKAKVVGWDALHGFGPDAVMVEDESALHEVTDDADHRAVDGTLEMVGKRALTELGNEIGAVEDVEFDPSGGTLETVLVGNQRWPATTLLGVGSYAVVLDRSTDPA